jgi:hypothetical protein
MRNEYNPFDWNISKKKLCPRRKGHMKMGPADVIRGNLDRIKLKNVVVPSAIP